MQKKNVIYFDVHFHDDDRKEDMMGIKKRYHDLQKASQTHLGWQWFLPLRDADASHLKSLRIPDTDEQWDFDDLVLSLAKILIDSLNEESLKN